MPRSQAAKAPSRRRLGFAAFALVATHAACLTPCPVVAHPLIEEAQAQRDEARFEDALLTLERAASESQLTRGELIELYLQRALVHLALQLTAAMATDLEMLATLDPNYEFGEEVPPPLREAFPRGAQRLSLDVDSSQGEGMLRLRLDVSGLRPDIVKHLELAARIAGTPDFSLADARELELAVAPGQVVEYYAIARGPGDSELATLGSPEAPEQTRVNAPLAATTAQGARPRDEESNDTWLWVTAGVVFAVAGATAAALLLREDARTQLSPPMVVQ
ncbi:MAG: hypothetical protein OEZ06_25930 [Myxococcales bacterium]|nr:hypothetical protein [Myxococcales bacterium]